MFKECFECDKKQPAKIKKLLNLSDEQEKELESVVLHYLDSVDMKKTNPEVMGELWVRFKQYTGIEDPYKDIKSTYNLELMKCYDEIKHIITASDDPFHTALKIAITGNLIDFSANHTFDMNMLKSMIQDILNKDLAIDDSERLKLQLSTAKSLLYIGDNCGEIVLDKLFIEVLKDMFPNLHIYFAVRGCAIANDVTFTDAYEVGMQHVASIISNGDKSLGAVYETSSKEFQQIFDAADVIIGKGMGNYEGLLPCENDHLYFLFMAKCKMIADPIHVDVMSIVCMKRHRSMVK